MSFLRRWPPLFFIGLLPVVCVLWLWADSMHYTLSWRHGLRGDEIRTVLSRGSHLHFEQVVKMERTPERQKARMPFTLGTTGPAGQLSRYPPPKGTSWNDWFPVPKSGVTYNTHMGISGDPEFTIRTRFRIVPYWLILAVYAPPWLLLSWWRARRRRRRIR